MRARAFFGSPLRTLSLLLKVPLTLALCCALVGFGVPRPLGAAVVVAPRPMAPLDVSSAYFAAGDRVVRTDLASRGSLGDTSDVEFRVMQAVFFDSSDEDSFDGSDLVALGDEETAAFVATNRDPSDLMGWEPVGELRWTTGPSSIRIVHAIGGDTVEVDVPRPAATCAEFGRSGLASVRVNGVDVHVDLERMRDGKLSADKKTELRQAWDRLDDPHGFARKSAGMGTLLTRTADPGGVGTLGNPWACLECAAQLGALGLTVLGMLTACGGPTMGWACVEAYLGATIVEVSALASCYRCLAEDPPGGGDDERDDEDEDEDEDEDDDECSCYGLGLCDCL